MYQKIPAFERGFLLSLAAFAFKKFRKSLCPIFFPLRGSMWLFGGFLPAGQRFFAGAYFNCAERIFLLRGRQHSGGLRRFLKRLRAPALIARRARLSRKARQGFRGFF